MTDNKNTSSGRSTSIFMGFIFMGMSLLVLGAGLFYGYESWQLKQHGYAISGEIVDYHERISDEDQQVDYAPVIAYHVDGQDFRFVSDNYANNPGNNIGESVPILYDLDDPAQARINRPMALWGLPAGLTFAGVLVFIVSIGIMRSGGRTEE